MSLRWRIMGATFSVVVLTVAISVGVGYYATQARLGLFVEGIGGEEAAQLARSLSREYTAAGGWATVDRALLEAGYAYQGASLPGTSLPGASEAGATEGQRERSEGGEGAETHSESSHQDPVRVVVADVNGRVVRDNFSELAAGAPVPQLEGHRETVFDLTPSPLQVQGQAQGQAQGQPQAVGQVFVDVNRELLATESHGLLNALLYITIIGGALTVGVAALLVAWLSQRITAPVTALTRATQAIARGDMARLPVSSSDELGRMSEAFNRMADTLETQRELRRRLINDVSHELNTPLSVILLEARGLRDGLQTPENAAEHIAQEVDRLKGLVTDLDWLAESDQGGLRLATEPTPVGELLAEEVDRWRPQCEARGVALTLEAAADGPATDASVSGLPVMDLDPRRMSQALGNVIGNAVNCVGVGGSVVVRARAEAGGGDVVAITVTDDGIGIGAEDLPHVFDRFYRTDQSRTQGIGGRGLGLAITRAIVEAHGGTVTVSSAGPGLGASVVVRLPVSW